MTQLESSTLKTHVGARADLQDEAKVNMHQAALGVNQDVAIVAILGLKQVASNCIPAKACTKILL